MVSLIIPCKTKEKHSSLFRGAPVDQQTKIEQKDPGFASHPKQNFKNTLAYLGKILGLAEEWKKITRNLNFGRFTTYQ